MLKKTRPILIIILAIILIFILTNALFSYLHLRQIKADIARARRIDILADTFARDPCTYPGPIPLASLTDPQAIRAFADNFDLKLWIIGSFYSSMYMFRIVLIYDDDQKQLFINGRSSANSHLIFHSWMQQLTPTAADYLIQTADSQGSSATITFDYLKTQFKLTPQQNEPTNNTLP